MTAKVKEAEKAYRIDEVADLFGVSPDFVRKSIKATSGNILAARIIGRSYRIKASDAQAWFDGFESA